MQKIRKFVLDFLALFWYNFRGSRARRVRAGAPARPHSLFVTLSFYHLKFSHSLNLCSLLFSSSCLFSFFLSSSRSLARSVLSLPLRSCLLLSSYPYLFLTSQILPLSPSSFLTSYSSSTLCPGVDT